MLPLDCPAPGRRCLHFVLSCAASLIDNDSMKIEIGESLGCSYLRHVKQCWLVQANWKTSEHWTRHKTLADLEAMFLDIKQKFDKDGDVFKQTNDAAQFLKQGEIDIVGMDQKGGIHAMEIAFHEAGLNYGGGVDGRVLKKLLRTLMILRAYHPSSSIVSIYFVSPKVNPGVQKPLESMFGTLRAEYPDVAWHLLTNANFTERMLKPTLQMSSTVADTSELFVRAAKLLELAEILPPRQLQQTNHARPEPRSTHAFENSSTRSTGAEKLQPLVQDLMNTLLVRFPSLLDEREKRNLMDRDYCKRFVGLQISNLPLLRRVENGTVVSGRPRYYRNPYGEFFVCSQWWKDRHTDNARSLLRYVTKIAQQNAADPNVARLERHMKALRDYLG